MALFNTAAGSASINILLSKASPTFQFSLLPSLLVVLPDWIEMEGDDSVVENIL